MRRAVARQVAAGGFVAVLLTGAIVLDRTDLLDPGDGDGERGADSVGEPADPGGRPAAATDAPGTTAPDLTAVRPPADGAATTLPPAIDVAELEDVAAAAVVAWQSPTVDERTAELTGLATESYLDASATIDPLVVPGAPPADASFQLESDGQALVSVTLADDTVLDVILARERGEWRVDDIRPRDRAGVPDPTGG